MAKNCPLEDHAQLVIRPTTLYFWTAFTSADQNAKSDNAQDAKCSDTGLYARHWIGSLCLKKIFCNEKELFTLISKK